MKRTIHEYPEKEKNYTKHMSEHIKYLTEQFLALRPEEQDKRSAIVTEFVQTLESVGPSVKLDIFFIHAVLKASAKILESQHLEQAVADQFIFQVLNECSQTLPPNCQEDIYYPPFIISCFNALQTIQQTASHEIKNIQSFQDNVSKLFHYIISTAQPHFKGRLDYMETAIKTHHLALEYVEGDLLIPEKSAQLYFNLLLQSHLDLKHIPSKIKDSQPFKDLMNDKIAEEMEQNAKIAQEMELNDKIAQEIEQNIYGIAFGFGIISIMGIFAYYCFQAMQQNDLNYSNTTYALC